MTALLCVTDAGAAVDAATVATVIVDSGVVVAAAEDSEGDVAVGTVSGAGVGSVEAVTGVLTVFSAAVTGAEDVCTLEGAAATGGGIVTASGCGDEVAAADVAGGEEEVADVAEDVTDSVDV